MQKELEKLRGRALRRGKGLREKAGAAAQQRKEEYLGARVPRELREQVIQRASALGMPVSIFIRQILEQAIDAASADARMPAASLDRRVAAPPSRTAGRFPHVLGWEQIRLNKSVACAACGTRLEAGISATLGLDGAGAEHVVLCQRCNHVA